MGPVYRCVASNNNLTLPWEQTFSISIMCECNFYCSNLWGKFPIYCTVQYVRYSICIAVFIYQTLRWEQTSSYYAIFRFFLEQRQFCGAVSLCKCMKMKCVCGG